ncbi:BGTF surface domain-containing protein [Halorubrum aethiopicum]|uniref:BGTF surface domain-containing protein n=1 Tax=Halorubrum aethiopicum TaxID=1758255 RepID=UPI0008319846|nr:BGTF surface domain-containing protein [Halorubrum aethiopicum]
MPTQPSTADEAGSIRRIARKLLPAAGTVLVATLAVVGIALAGSALVGTAAADGTAELDASIVTVTEGDTAAVEVETDGVDEVEVAIGDESTSGYELRATVTPDDDDGTTRLVFDHAETGGGGTPLTAEGDAAVSIESETDLDEPIAPGSYDVSVSVDGDEPADIGNLMVEPESTGDGAGDDEDGSPDEGDGSDDSAETTVTESDVEAADVVVEPAETDVTVPVDLADGETVTLRIRSAADASPAYIKTEEATVEDGEATARFDLSETSHGDRATLTVRGNDGLDGESEHEVLVVDESIGVEEADGGSGDDSTDGSASDDGTTTSVPGFGVVAAALALLGGALVARRRA